MAKNLTQLTERTATADTDLMHINSGGTDYKETKADFLKGDFWHLFDNTSLLTTQAENLPVGTWFGYVLSYGHQTETGVPNNSSYLVKAVKYSSTYIVVSIEGLSATPNDNSYIIAKGSGGWGSWTKEVTRAEVVSLPKMGALNAGATMTLTDCPYAICFFFLNSNQTAILGCRSGAIAEFVKGSSIDSYLSWSPNGSNSYTFTNLTETSGIRYCIIQSAGTMTIA